MGIGGSKFMETLIKRPLIYGGLAPE